MRFSNSILIDRSLADVFAFLADPTNIPRWNYAITSVQQLTPGPVGPGTRFRQHRQIPQPGEEELEITEFAPPSRLTLSGDVGPFHGRLSYALEARNGGTLLVNGAELEGRGVARLLAPVAMGRIRAAVAQNLDVLRRMLEAQTQR